MPIVKVRAYSGHGYRAECVCDYCEESFERCLSNVKGRKRVFCSQAHFNAFRGANPKVWTSVDGYVCAWSAEKGRHFPVHRLIVEEALGRELLPNEVVHHKDGIRAHNRLENLELRVRGDHAPGYVDANLQTINSLLQKNETLTQKVLQLERP